MYCLKNVLRGVVLATFTTGTAFAKNIDNPDPKWTEQWEPQPKVIKPGPVPSDALVLLGDEGLGQWQHSDGKEAQWHYKDGVMTVNPGTKGIRSKAQFCDMQLHIEWRSPKRSKEAWKVGQHSGNSGIYIQGRYEIQVLDSYENKTYANGQAGALYKQAPPLVNASLPPMTWQSYDIIFRAPRFNDKGLIDQKGTVTVLHNGVVIQNNTVIQGGTTYRGLPSYPKAHGCAPVHLQDHGNPVSFRNIWVRRL